MTKLITLRFNLSEETVQLIDDYCNVTGLTRKIVATKSMNEFILKHHKEITFAKKQYLKEQQKQSELDTESAVNKVERDKLREYLRKVFLPKACLTRIGELAVSSLFLNKGIVGIMPAIIEVIDRFEKMYKNYDKKTKIQLKGDMEILKTLRNEEVLKDYVNRARFHLFDKRSFKTREFEKSQIEDRRIKDVTPK